MIMKHTTIIFNYRYPSAPCSYIDHKVYSQCLQKHNFVRLLAYTYEEGLHIDSFKMPVACSCHIEVQLFTVSIHNLMCKLLGA